MKMNEVDRILQDALTPMECPSELLNMKIKNMGMEEKGMRNMKRGRVIILAAAICLVLGTVAFAASVGGYSISRTDKATEQTDYDKLGAIAEKAGFSFDSVENFSNGFQFESMNTSDCENVDAEGNSQPYQSVKIAYSNSENQKVLLNIAPAEFAKFDGKFTESFKLKDTDCYYNVQLMKLIPEGYIMSEEEKQQMEDGTVWFSSGGEDQEVEELTWYFMSWTDGDCYYNLSTDEIQLSGEEMFSMAKEIMEK